MAYLLCDASAGDAYVTKDFGTDIPDLWVTVSLRFDAAALAFWATAGQYLIATFNVDPTFEDYLQIGFDATPHWAGGWAGAQTPPDPVVDSFQVVEFRYQAGVSEDIYIDGVLLASTPVVSSGDETRSVAIGLYAATPDAANVVQVDDVKFGTTRGASDLGADDFEGGDLSFWTTTVGDVSIAGGPATPPPTPTPLPAWRLEYWDHDYVAASEGSSSVVAGEGKLQTVAPENLHFVLRLGALGVHEAQWETSRYARQFETGDYALEVFVPEAEAHDFRLTRDGNTILAGEVRETDATVEADEGVTHLSVAGEGFLGYLDQRFWPSGSGYDARAQEVADVVSAVLTAARDADDYSLRFDIDCDTTGTSIDYTIDPRDTTPVGDKIRGLSMFADDSGGFDYQIETDDSMAKTFRLYHPRLGDPDSPVLTLSGQPKIATLEYRNRGPAATHVLGSGAGSVQSTERWPVDWWIPGGGMLGAPDEAAAAKYLRRDAAAEFPDQAGVDQVAALTKAQFESMSKIVEELPLTVNAAKIPDFWTTVFPGVYITVDYDFGWMGGHIVVTQRVVEMDCTITNEVVETVVLTLNPPQLLPSHVLQPPQINSLIPAGWHIPGTSS